MASGTKILTEILAGVGEIHDTLRVVAERLGALEDAVAAIQPAPEPPASPAPVTVETELALFARPATGEPLRGFGERMTWPDRAEVVLRALYGVTWAGTIGQFGEGLEEAWGEVERLKREDATLVPYYRAFEPAMAGVALLTGLIRPVAADGASWGINRIQREALSRYTVQEWISAQLSSTGGPSG